MTTAQGFPGYLPAGVEVRYMIDHWEHKVSRIPERDGGGASPITSWRPLAVNQEESRQFRRDFYHPTLGMIWEGYKLAKDRSMDDIIRDTTQTVVPSIPTEFNSGQGVN